MSYQALYRKYRPKRFEEVVGQEYIVATLLNAIKQNKIAHAYLFAGPRGTGKTSVAKLMAKVLNCQNEENSPCMECENCKSFINNNHPDVIELDAASNNSVDDIREIIDKVSYAPILGKYKIYIIDEVHMLSNSAFNALLKTLEEPPKNVIFILATTDPQKIISTVLSRVQRYNFKKVEPKYIIGKIIEILDKEQVTYEKEAVSLIASLADGGMRDALSILDQVLVYGNNTLLTEKVYEAYGVLRKEHKIALIYDILNKDTKAVMNKAYEYVDGGIDLKRLTNDLLKILKELLIYKSTDYQSETLTNKELEQLSNKVDKANLLLMIDELMDVLSKYKNAQELSDYFELTLLKLINLGPDIEKQQIVTKETTKEVIEEKQKTEEVEETIEDIVEQDNTVDTEVVEDVEVNEQPEINFVDYTLDYDFLLFLLKKATKQSKEEDKLLYDLLDDYKYDVDKRSCYIAIKEAELIASNEEAIIFEHQDKNSINETEFNKKLYFFFKNDLGIDKMIYAIDEDDKQHLFNLYRQQKETKNYKIEKYQEEKGKTLEDKLQDVYPNMDVVED